MRGGHHLVFLGAAQSFAHYSAVLKKMGLNLPACVDSGQVVFFDLFSRPFDCNTFDNLPPSQAVPNTCPAKVPKKLQSLSITEDAGHLFAKIHKSLRTLSGKQTLVLFDNVNMLLTGGDSPLDLIESLNEATSLAFSFPATSVALGVNRDLIFDGEDFYRELKRSEFDHVYEVARNVSGYTKDVHGQLNIIRQGTVKNVKFRLTENKVEVFEHFVI